VTDEPSEVAPEPPPPPPERPTLPPPDMELIDIVTEGADPDAPVVIEPPETR
jgi:hypothetical protein